MAKKIKRDEDGRRDIKKRPLRPGETQKKDGRYMFKYKDLDGKTCYAYSWRLTKNDPLRKGKPRDIPLREKERLIQEDLLRGISHSGGNTTVLAYVEKYIETKSGVRDTTKANYKTVLNILKKKPFGRMKIKDVRQSDARLFLVALSNEGKGISSIYNVRGVLRPAFRMAYDDQLISRNPFDFMMKTIMQTKYVKRNALSKDQTHRFLNFLKSDKHFSEYHDAIQFLFETGLRISEFAGLTLDDIDMENKKIRIDHELMRNSNMEYYVDKPKTDAGIRTIPLSSTAYQTLQRILEKRPDKYDNFVVYGRPEAPKKEYSRFLFYDKNGLPRVALHWEHYMSQAIAKHNKIYKKELPKITPHMCRHTYATNRVAVGMSPKTLQYLMGHESIETTMQYYVHWNDQLAEEEVKKIDGLQQADSEDEDEELYTEDVDLKNEVEE